MPRGLLFLLALLIAPCALHGSNDAPGSLPALSDVLARAGETVERYYARAQSLIATESVVQQSLRSDLTPDDSFARRLVYERRVAWDASADGAAPEARVQREIVRVNSRAPRPNDKPKCFDPSTTESDQMQMLLAANRGDYTFTLAGVGRIDRREALMIDFREKVTGPIVVRQKEGVEGCFSVEMPGQNRGRIWLVPETFEVLRIDVRLNAPITIHRSAKDLKSRFDLDATFDRYDSSTLYRAVRFADPDETLILPASVVRVSVETGARQRETTTFTNYRRFVAEGRIVDQ